MEGWMKLGRMKEEGMGELLTSTKLFSMEGVYELSTLHSTTLSQ